MLSAKNWGWNDYRTIHKFIFWSWFFHNIFTSGIFERKAECSFDSAIHANHRTTGGVFMNRLEKLRDEKTKEFCASLAYFGNASFSSVYQNGWNACAAEYEKIIKELEWALEATVDRYFDLPENERFGPKNSIESEESKRARLALGKLKEWRGGSCE